MVILAWSLSARPGGGCGWRGAVGGDAAAVLRGGRGDQGGRAADRVVAADRRAVRSDSQPRYRRPARGSKLDAYRDEIHRLLGEDPRLPGTRVRELLEPLGYDGSKTILDDYLREVRPLFLPKRTFQRTVYRPGEVCQFDLWEPREQIPVGYGQTRRGWVVVAALGYSRAGAGALIFSKQAEDILSGMSRCLWRLGGVARTLVWDHREGALHAGDGRASDALAGYCGMLRCGWYLCQARDPQAKGVGRALTWLHGDELRAGPPVRQPPRLSTPAGRVVLGAGEWSGAQDVALPASRSAGRRRRGDAAAAGAGAGHRSPLGCVCRPTRTCASTPATTRSTPHS